MSGSRATCRVTVEVVVTLKDRWGGDCPVDQVRKQAQEGAMNRLSALFSEESDLVASRASAYEVTILEKS